jgi:hypothetical protein
MTEVWLNVYEKEDASLKSSLLVYATRAEADKYVIEGRVGCVRVSLDRRFDAPAIPQEVGALIGKRVGYQCIHTALEEIGIILGDYRLDPGHFDRPNCILLSDCKGTLRTVPLETIKRLIT